MKKASLILFVLIALVFSLRIFHITYSPPGFYSDESLTGYEAYSLLKTGRDQYGNFLPITFKAFGDFRPGLFIYTTIPFVWLLGLTEFAVRLPSAVFSTVTGVIIFFLSYELFKNQKAAFLSLLLFALSPWSLQFARMSHDTNLSTFLLVMAVYLFLKGMRQKNFLLPFSFFLFSLSLYVYYTTRVFVPLFVFFLLFFFRKKLFSQKKNVVLALMISSFTLIPLALVLVDKEQGWSRIDAVGLWNDPGITAGIIQSRQEDLFDGNFASRLFHNKIIDTTRAFGKNLLSHFEPSFLFFNGDPVKLYNTPGNGILQWIEPLFLIVGVAYVWRKRFWFTPFLLVWFVLGLLPDSLTRLAPATARIHLNLPLVSMIGGYGWYCVWQWCEEQRVRIVFKYVIVSFILGNSFYFFHEHLIHTRIAYAREWHYGVKEIAQFAQSQENNFEEIWVSKSAWGWINFVFFQKYNPVQLQKEIVLSKKNEYGLGWVYRYGKYYFDDFPKVFDVSKNRLYIGEPQEFPVGVVPLHVVYYPDRSKAYYIVATKSIRDVYEKQN